MYSFSKILALILLGICSGSIAASLSEEALSRGINETCNTYLGQIEESNNLNGLNITFAHPQDPNKLPSLHISSQKYNNGTSTFTTTLNPDGDYCYLSTITVTSINNQSCNEIAQLKTESENLKISKYANGVYIVLTPPDNSFQTILISSGENSCTMTEARMMWPGR
jgi:hypothetical protein